MRIEGWSNSIAEKYLHQLKTLEDCGDFEWAHSKADKLLCDFIRELGYDDVVEAWDKVGKWYA